MWKVKDMKKFQWLISMILIISLLTACGDNEENSGNEESQNKQEESEQQEDSDIPTDIPEDIFFEASMVEDIVRDTGRFIVEEFGYQSNVNSDIKDGPNTVGLQEVHGYLGRFYNESSSIRFNNNRIEMTLIGELGEDYDDTYLDAMIRTKKLLDFLFTYSSVDLELVSIDWYYPYKLGAADDGYTLYPVYSTSLSREEYQEGWEDLQTDEMTLENIQVQHMIEPKDALIMPFVDDYDRHDKVGEEYDMNGFKATLIDGEYVESINGETAQEYCSQTRNCETFIRLNFNIKNERDYPITVSADSLIRFPFTDGEEQGAFMMYPDPIEGVETYVELQPGEEAIISPHYPMQGDVEYPGITLSTAHMDIDRELRTTYDASYIYTWLLEDVIKE